MAKKRTIDLENAEPLRDLPSSGIQVNYKHQTIIASDETSEYALLTGGKICEANIGVVYVKPETPVLVPFKLINNTQDTLNEDSNNVIMRVINGGLVVYNDRDYSEDGLYILPEEGGDSLIVNLAIFAQTDKYDVLMNDVPVSYENDPGAYFADLTITQFTAATHFTITVNDKPANGR